MEKRTSRSPGRLPGCMRRREASRHSSRQASYPCGRNAIICTNGGIGAGSVSTCCGVDSNACQASADRDSRRRCDVWCAATVLRIQRTERAGRYAVNPASAVRQHRDGRQPGRGRNGKHVAEHENGVDGGGPPFAQRVLSSKAQIVLDAHAVNDDLAQSLGPYEDALIAFVQSVRAAGKIAVLEEPGPVCDDSRPHIENYVSVMDSVAEQYNVPIVKQYAYLQTIPNLCSHYSGGIYPDNAIFQIKAQRQAVALAPLVKAALGE